MNLLSWNVNGIRAAAKKGFLEFMATTDADVVFLQETKANRDQLPDELLNVPGWGVTFHSGVRKGYSGVAAYYRKEPDEVVSGLGVDKFDDEGRAIMVRYGDLCIFGNYFPNGGKGPERVDYKLEFYDVLLQRMNALRKQGRQVVVCGDYNTAHYEVDLARPKANRKTSGFLQEERAWLDRYVDEGYVDTFRHLHPDAVDRYSWWSWRTNSRERNIGWRIDYFFVDESLRDRVAAAEIHDEQHGSDHAPITLTLN